MVFVQHLLVGREPFGIRPRHSVGLWLRHRVHLEPLIKQPAVIDFGKALDREAWGDVINVTKQVAAIDFGKRFDFREAAQNGTLSKEDTLHLFLSYESSLEALESLMGVVQYCGVVIHGWETIERLNRAIKLAKDVLFPRVIRGGDNNASEV